MTKSIIVGTAGHIDHGKSALIEALTGTHPDRLEEEKRRGITIDLGFAFLEEEGVRFGFVDVPGHERFVKNMLAGTSGIDLVLLVIAADEAIKPQTREHFDICRLLGVKRGVIALTKTDLVGRDSAELVRLEVEDFVKGSFLEGAPILAVSAKTGAGLAELKKVLSEEAQKIPEKQTERYFRLPIDRSFAVKGFGTVVTGTLISGQIAAGDEVELLPEKKLLRVRGVQTGGKGVERASAGQRTAVNLASIEHSAVQRGMVIAAPGRFTKTRRIDARHGVAAWRARAEAQCPRALSRGDRRERGGGALVWTEQNCGRANLPLYNCDSWMTWWQCAATATLCGDFRRSSPLEAERFWIRWRVARREKMWDAWRF